MIEKNLHESHSKLSQNKNPLSNIHDKFSCHEAKLFRIYNLSTPYEDFSETFLNYSVFHSEIQSLRMPASKCSRPIWKFLFTLLSTPTSKTSTTMGHIPISNSVRSYVTLFKNIGIISQESPNLCLTTEQHHNNCWQLSNQCSPTGLLKLGLKAGLWKSIMLSAEKNISGIWKLKCRLSSFVTALEAEANAKRKVYELLIISCDERFPGNSDITLAL